MRQGTAQAEQGRTAEHKGTMRLDNMRPQSGQQEQEASKGADKDSGGRSSDGIQASRCRRGKQIRPDSRIKQQIQPARKYPFLSVCGIFAQVAAMGRRPESLAPSTFAAGVVGACAIKSGIPPPPCGDCLWRSWCRSSCKGCYTVETWTGGAVFTSAGDIDFYVRL